MPLFLVGLLSWLGNVVAQTVAFLVTKRAQNIIITSAYISAAVAAMSGFVLYTLSLIASTVSSLPSEYTYLFGLFLPDNTYPCIFVVMVTRGTAFLYSFSQSILRSRFLNT